MSSNELFKNKITNPSKEGLYFKLIITSANSTKDYFCIVEGKTDVLFYSSIRHSFFKKKQIDYFHADSNSRNKDLLVGKEAVINTCSILLAKNPSLMKRCVFIVDHDDFGVKNYIDKYSESVLSKITVLPVYSFENYFFNTHNFRRVIMPLFSSEFRKVFDDKFLYFKECAIRYFSLKRVITATYQFSTLKKLDNFKPKYTENDIFCFLPKENFIDLDKLNYEVENMMSAIIESKPHNKLYKDSLNLLENNIDFIKGKILYGFFAAILKDITEKDVGDKRIYIELVKKLEVDLEVVIN